MYVIALRAREKGKGEREKGKGKRGKGKGEAFKDKPCDVTIILNA
jgi:hypothetical protein